MSPDPGMHAQLRLVPDAGEPELRQAVGRLLELERQVEVNRASGRGLYLTVEDELEEARIELCRVAVQFVQGGPR